MFDLQRFGRIEDLGLGFAWDGEMFEREVAHRAAILSQLGAGPGSVIAIFHSGTARFFADLFAVWRIGAAAACLDSSLTGAELRTVVDFAQPLALLVDRTPPPIGDLSVPVLQLAMQRPARDTTKSADNQVNDHPALILFTSGTTGVPKGVVLTYGALKTRLEINAAVIGAPSLARTLVTLPTHFGHGLIGNALTPLANGADIVLSPPGISLGDQLGRIVDEHSITFLSSVPSLWKIALGSSKAPTRGSLRRVHVGSAPLSANLWGEIATWSSAEVVNCYGMTETANWFAGGSSWKNEIADGFVGRPWGGVVAVMDDRGNVEAKGDGEIVLQSPCLMRGYLNRSDLTAAAISNGWFRTGDRGTIDESGQIWLTGRIKDEINRAGFKVQPAELDLLLEQHPQIAEACVFGIPDPIAGEAIGVAVKPSIADTIDLEAVRAWCRERLRRDAIPERWFVLHDIPRNVRGKVNRAALSQALLGDSPATRRSTGATEIVGASKSPEFEDDVRRAVERAWVKVLDRCSFQKDMQWSDAGGDSLGALSLLHYLEHDLDRSIPLDVLRFEMTPSDLIRNVAKLCTSADVGSYQGESDEQRPLVFLLPPAYGDLPALADFRAALSSLIRFDVIQYPNFGEMLDKGAGFDSLIDAALAQINAVCTNQSYLLAGYSFGGLVAFEVARRLVAAGRKVDLLALIDARLDSSPERPASFIRKTMTYLGKRWLSPERLYRDGIWQLLNFFVRHSPLVLLRRTVDFARMMPGRTAMAFQIEIFTLLRAQAVRHWNFKPLDIPTTLLRSNEAEPSQPDYGWGRLCRKLTVLPIQGGHRSLFEPKYRQALSREFMGAVERAVSQRGESARQHPTASQHKRAAGL